MSTGRNDPCPCGSGKKYKKCCLEQVRAAASPTVGRRMEDVVLSSWSMERSKFTPLGAEAVALGKELPNTTIHPWTRARILDWFAKQDHAAARRPVVKLSEVRRYSTATLVEQLAQHGVPLDADAFRVRAASREGRSAWDFASELLACSPRDVPEVFGLAVCELWRRELPDRPSLEMLDELMEEGYLAVDPRDGRAACELWLTFTDHLLEALPASVQSLDEADAAFPGLQSIANWMMDVEMCLHNASVSDPELARRGIAWCQAMTARLDDDQRFRFVRGLEADLHVMAGQPQEGVRVAEALRATFPHDALGYVTLAEIYSRPGLTDLYDPARAIRILEEALAVPVHNGEDFSLAARLEELRGHHSSGGSITKGPAS